MESVGQIENNNESYTKSCYEVSSMKMNFSNISKFVRPSEKSNFSSEKVLCMHGVNFSNINSYKINMNKLQVMEKIKTKISVVGLDFKILDELHKFSFPIQQLLADEVCAVEKRIENDKAAPGLTSLDSYCWFHLQKNSRCLLENRRKDDDKQMGTFIRDLKFCLEPILDNANKCN
ncbi:13493_t:CDS:2 [Cetraspora pellucida]|uniref:13493_t:CDS:1 n=1 Tax=Cetraspora pellucida TaxID=1433469 RepID=A0A9N8VNT1_9GLOM|nr:13493_t:CDS:2 [Cetraspora pellucida]